VYYRCDQETNITPCLATLFYDALRIHKCDTKLHAKLVSKSIPQYGEVWDRMRLSKLILH